VITGGVNVVIQLFKNLGLTVANIVLGIGNAIAALASNMMTAFHNAICSIQSWFYNLLSTGLSVIEGICAALNKLPFVEFDYSDISSAADDYAAKASEAAGNKEDYQSISDAFNEGFTTFDAFQDDWASDAFNAGAAWGDGVADKVSNFSLSDVFGQTDIPNVGDYTSGFSDAIANSGVGDGIGNIDDNTGKIKDSLDITEEDLKYLRDIAEQEAINRFTTAEINVDMSGMQNTVNSGDDIDGFMTKLTDSVNEAVDMSKWQEADMMGCCSMYVELLVGNESGTKVYQPVVQEGIEWSTERKNTPGKLVFKVLYDNILDFSEGSPVRMKVDGDNVFFGFVFKQQRTKDKIITVTAYDQLRYLKNKDTKVYEGKTANQFVKMIADDYALNLGTLDDTGYVIESRVEENTSLFEMIANALDLTLTNTGEMYVLYDDFGKLTLKSLSSMYVGVPGAYLMIDEETGQNFDYTSSIDENTYNKIKLTYDNKDTGKRDVYITQDSSNINKWGILQYFDTLQKGENGQAKADALLKLYNKKTRNLKITNALGDNRVRAGSMVVINLDLGDIKLKNWMLVEKCKHTYKEGEHWMDLTLRGGEFVA